MGKSASKLPTEKMKEYLRETTFTESELKLWYKYFMRECPNGSMDSDQFLSIYKLFHPSGRPDQFASHVFRVFDRNKDGVVDFDDFLGALHITAKGWQFEMNNPRIVWFLISSSMLFGYMKMTLTK